MISLKSLARSGAVVALVAAMPALAASSVTANFDGPDLALNITVGGGFIPPDTMGAVGTTQFATFLNGSFGVYDKATGTRTQFLDDDVFWRNAGATSFGGAFTNGDPRIRYNAQLGKWIAIAFGGDVSFVNIGVSDTADATGTWRAATFNAFNGVGGNGVADYPTLAFDTNAVYIGTNDFAPGFQGSTLNVFPLADIFAAGGPDLSGLTQFTSRAPFANDLGYSQQGVNSDDASRTVGQVVADGITNNGVAFNIANPGGANPTIFGREDLEGQVFDQNNPARQPDGSRTLDTLDTRISSSVYEHNGKIYFTRTVTPTGTDYTNSRVTVLDATTFEVVQEFDIDDGNYDHYQSSLAVNENGAVIQYNRSGFDTETGNISVFANSYTLDENGLLVFDENFLIVESLNPGYSLGSPRNRWGDYSQVTIDPTDPNTFWLIGEYANFRAGGADGWATRIAAITFDSVEPPPPGIPEPATWGLMIAGFGMVGFAARRRRTAVVSA